MKIDTKQYIEGCKPFLRWAGGKGWLLKQIDNFLPAIYNCYHEPFVGGGSVYFHLQPYRSILSDLNHELINAFLVVKTDVEKVIEHLLKYENSEDFYYKMRSKKPKTDIARAARFIYLNKTSFNGIYRENLAGDYNVPYGRRKNYAIDISNFMKASHTLQKAQLKCQDFFLSLDDIGSSDLVFLDPPYTVTHNNNGFVKYNSSIFNEDAQRKLASYIDIVDEIGGFYIMTNAAHKWVYNLFKRKNNSIYELKRFSRVGGVNATRGNYDEYLITNIF